MKLLDFMQKIRNNQSQNARTQPAYSEMLLALDKAMRAGQKLTHNFGSNTRTMIAEVHLMKASIEICKALSVIEPENITVRQLAKRFEEKIQELTGVK